MSKEQKLTGVILNGVVYKVTALSKRTSPCDSCDVEEFCNKNQNFQSLCYFQLPKYANFKKDAK